MDKKFLFSVFLIIGGFFLTTLTFWKFQSPAWLGIGTFITLFIAFYIDNQKLDSGEMRRVIAGSLIATFFGLMSVNDDKIKFSLFNNYWKIIMMVIGFYFTSRVFDNFSIKK